MLCNYTYIFLLKSVFFSQRQHMSICNHATMHTRSHTVHSKHYHRGLRKGGISSVWLPHIFQPSVVLDLFFVHFDHGACLTLKAAKYQQGVRVSKTLFKSGNELW